MNKDLLFLNSYKKKVDRALKESINDLGEKTTLRDACEYALTGDGKRLRPIITFLIAKEIGKNFDVTYSAVAVEYFHVASLIADDLPCMDDEDFRRKKPALHKAFEKSVAILASYTLISHGYEMLSKNARKLEKDKNLTTEKASNICLLSLEEVSKIAGIFGATNGQFLDLFPPDHSKETILKIMKQKTAALFEISFVLGWLFGGGDVSDLKKIKEAAYHFGMAFQIADDLIDHKEDRETENINIVNAIGYQQAIDMFDQELLCFEKKIKEVSIFTSFKKLIDLLKKTIQKR